MNTRARRNIFMLILVLCVSLILPSCGKGERLEVVSEDFPKLRYLEAGEFDQGQADRINAPDFELNNMYYVSEKDGKLFIYNGINEYSYYRDSYMIHLNYTGYFVGINMGEFGGWLRYYDERPFYNTEEGILVSNSNCLGYQEVDSEKLFLFVGDVAHLFNKGRTEIYLAEYVDQQWNWKPIAEVDGSYRVGYYDKETETLYVVTLTGIYAIDKSGELFSYNIPDYIDDLVANSATVIDGVLYIGSWCGIYAQPVDGSASTWYPLSPN